MVLRNSLTVLGAFLTVFFASLTLLSASVTHLSLQVLAVLAVLTRIPRVVNLPFSPMMAALTFPSDILAKVRFRANREHLQRCQGRSLEGQGQNLALTVLRVPSSLGAHVPLRHPH